MPIDRQSPTRMLASPAADLSTINKAAMSLSRSSNDRASEFAEELRRAREGDLAALNRLLDRLRPILRLRARGKLARRLGRRLDTSDVVQETMIQVNRDAHRFRGRCEAEWCAWAQKILRGKVSRMHRFHTAAKRNVAAETLSAVLGQLSDEAESPQQSLERDEQLLQLSLAIESLPELSREVVIRRVSRRESFEQIGQGLGRSSGAVRVIWTRTLRRLKSRIEVER